MYAVIKTGGKQYKVVVGQIIKVEKLEVLPGEKVTFDQVLMMKTEDGAARIGSPVLADILVQGVVLEQGRAKKIVVYKYKRRKNERKKQGHRQAFTKVLIEGIGTAAEIEAQTAAKLAEAEVEAEA